MDELLYPAAPLLIVDDEELILQAVGTTLKLAKINNVIRINDSRRVEQEINRQEVSCVILDLLMPHIPGIELLPIILKKRPNAQIIIMTGAGDLESAVECMRGGVQDYLVKPVDKTRLLVSVRNAIRNWEVTSENLSLRKSLITTRLEHKEAFASIITQSEKMYAIYRYVEVIAKTHLPVLITGETGVGKELLAKAIHAISARAREFESVNIAGLDDNLFSDTLFGHKKGAYTNATEERQGIITRAAGGTVFLDEIGDLTIESQIKLLRLLQEREYYPLGSDKKMTTNARFIFTTNKDLNAETALGGFRADLFYRLYSHHIHLPPLRERKEDIPLLTDYLLAKAALQLEKKKPTPPAELYTLLRLYDFPGNIRELEGMIFDAVVRHRSGVLSLEVFKNIIQKHSPQIIKKFSHSASSEAEINPFAAIQTLPTLKQATNDLIQEVLQRTGGNQSLAAEILGIGRTGLNKRLKKME